MFCLAGWKVAGGQVEKPDIRTSQDRMSAPSFQDSMYTHISHMYIHRHASTGERDYVMLLFEIREERKRLMRIPSPA